MTFTAVTKNIKSMYSSNDFERLFIRYKAEAMPRKSMVQGYKTSNCTRTGTRTDGNGSQSLKGSVLFSYSEKKRESGIISTMSNIMTSTIR